MKRLHTKLDKPTNKKKILLILSLLYSIMFIFSGYFQVILFYHFVYWYFAFFYLFLFPSFFLSSFIILSFLSFKNIYPFYLFHILIDFYKSNQNAYFYDWFLKSISCNSITEECLVSLGCDYNIINHHKKNKSSWAAL